MVSVDVGAGETACDGALTPGQLGTLLALFISRMDNTPTYQCPRCDRALDARGQCTPCATPGLDFDTNLRLDAHDERGDWSDESA